MPYRKIPLVTGEIYHVFNRSVAGQTILLQQNDYKRALEVIEFYIFNHTPLSFSHFRRLTGEEQGKVMQLLHDKKVTIIAYCLMPNHFHFLLKQNSEDGIRTFMTNFQNSYAKYFNTRTKRHGALFQAMFKAVRIEDDDQLIHVARYIHLNPATAYIIKNSQTLKDYLWSSFSQYLNSDGSGLAETKIILDYFKSQKEFEVFTLDQADYQRQLDRIKHLTFE